MTSLTILGDTEILCSFKLALERKAGKEIHESSILKFLEKFSANNFALSDAEDNTSRLLNRAGLADLPLLRTLLAIRKKWEVFLGSIGLFCFINIRKFGTLKNPFATITSLSEFYFRSRRFIHLVQTKKLISLSNASSKSG